jgi:hypothetical protein
LTLTPVTAQTEAKTQHVENGYGPKIGENPVKLSAPLDAEIVVINNASEDDTAAVLSQWAGKKPVPGMRRKGLAPEASRKRSPRRLKSEGKPDVGEKGGKGVRHRTLWHFAWPGSGALPGCNANWPPIGSKEEAKLLARIPHSTEAGGGTTPANDLCNLASKLVLATAPSPIYRR